MLTETTVGRFIDPKYPLIATARLSGMMLDYPKLLEKGIGGLRQEIFEKFKKIRTMNSTRQHLMPGYLC